MKVNVYFNRWIFKALNNNSKDHVLNSIFTDVKIMKWSLLVT